VIVVSGSNTFFAGAAEVALAPLCFLIVLSTFWCQWFILFGGFFHFILHPWKANESRRLAGKSKMLKSKSLSSFCLFAKGHLPIKDPLESRDTEHTLDRPRGHKSTRYSKIKTSMFSSGPEGNTHPTMRDVWTHFLSPQEVSPSSISKTNDIGYLRCDRWWTSGSSPRTNEERCLSATGTRTNYAPPPSCICYFLLIDKAKYIAFKRKVYLLKASDFQQNASTPHRCLSSS